jgi:leader peptidase (prepilin peptidase) / N-methyltransferase
LILNFNLPLGAALAASLPAGWGLAWIARRETGINELPVALFIGPSLALAAWTAMVMPATYLLWATFLLGWILLLLSTVDLLAFRLPDILTFPLLTAGLVLSLWLPDQDPLAHVIGAAMGFVAFYGIALAYRRARGREGLGLGDAKLAAAAGAWLGWQALPSMVLIACAAGFVWIGVAVIVRGKSALTEEIAFGVPLCFAFWIVWLYGPPDLAGLL